MAQHIGISGGSAEGAALCYRTICAESAEAMGRHAHPEISLHTYALHDYLRFISVGDWDSVSRLMLASAKKLSATGAEFVIYPDNTIHQAFDQVRARSPLPLINTADVVIQEMIDLEYRKPGILGTRRLMEGPVYTRRLAEIGMEFCLPEESSRERIDHIIYDELVLGHRDEGAQRYLVHVVERFREKGCDAVILGSSLLPLILTADMSPVPLLDSTRLLARKALRTSIGAH